MKYLILFFIYLLVQYNVAFAQKEVSKDYKSLVDFVYKAVDNNDTAKKNSHFFSIKAIINSQHKIDTIFFSKNISSDLKEKLSLLKQLPVNWDNIITLKKGVRSTIIIPVIDFMETPSGAIRFSSYKDLLNETFVYEDNNNLFDNKLISNVWLLEAIQIHKFIEVVPQQ
jgi:hypothetical protein